VDLDAGHYSLLACTFDPDNEAKFKAALFTTSAVRFAGDEAAAEADDEGVTTLAATPAAAPAASSGGDVDKIREELVKEKKEHLKTIAANTVWADSFFKATLRPKNIGNCIGINGPN